MNYCITAGNIAEYEINPGAKYLVIWSDHDASYDREESLLTQVVKAALTFKERAESMGIKVDIIAPIQVGDWLNFPEKVSLPGSILPLSALASSHTINAKELSLLGA